MNDVIRQQLPYLRRFARALHGRQAVADQLVAQAIEAVGAERAQADPQTAEIQNEPPLRQLLFRALIDAHVGNPGSAGDIVTLADERILASRIRALPADAARRSAVDARGSAARRYRLHHAARAGRGQRPAAGGAAVLDSQAPCRRC
jgi:DNA-directed RNA polymerase specialized sigma24 family protein